MDRVDDCEDVELQELIPLLLSCAGRAGLQLCIPFRTGVGVESKIDLELTPHLVLTIPFDNPDIAGFIETELELRLNSGSLSLGNPAIILEILEVLRNGAQGM